MKKVLAFCLLVGMFVGCASTGTVNSEYALMELNSTHYTEDKADVFSPDLTKVYLHSITDLDDRLKTISSKKQKDQYGVDIQFDTAFYDALKDELKYRGILIVDAPSSYTLRVDFAFDDFSSLYIAKDEYLKSKIQGKLRIKNINYDKISTIETVQSVSGFRASSQKDFEAYMNLLAKEMAKKVARKIAEF